MAIYEISGDHFKAVPPTTFAAAGVRERQDLQRYLRDQIEVIAPDTLVIAEEFGEWDESGRRIDLLAVDRDANLVVIELKRTENGGHMELQAVRYAGMVSTLTFDRAVEVFSYYLAGRGDQRDAEQALLGFLGWDSENDGEFAGDVRIVLASADFSRELTSSVMWLASHGIDIRCVCIRPYGDACRVLLDIQQLIPLPEAEEYQVRIRQKQSEERTSRRTRGRSRRYRVHVAGKKFDQLPCNQAILRVVQGLCHAGVAPDSIAEVITWRAKNNNLFRSADGNLDAPSFAAAFQGYEGSDSLAGGWFLADNELIHYEGRTYALTWHWGGRTEEAMNKLIERFKVEDIAFEVCS